MKITHNKVGQNLNLVDGAKTDATKAGKSGALKDAGQDLVAASGLGATKVELSDRAMEAKRIKELAKASPDVDMEKVERFRRMIDEGTYKVDAKSVADRMVDEHLETMG